MPQVGGGPGGGSLRPISALPAARLATSAIVPEWATLT
jgi:hypothetical protein